MLKKDMVEFSGGEKTSGWRFQVPNYECSKENVQNPVKIVRKCHRFIPFVFTWDKMGRVLCQS